MILNRKRPWNRRRLRFASEGKWFVGITLGVGFAAINTGNNLLYLCLGMMLSLVIISGILSDISLRKVTARRKLVRRIHARQPFLVGIAVTNDKSHFSSFSVEVEDVAGREGSNKRCYFLKVLPERTQETAYRECFDRRGLYSYKGLSISPRYPFGLFQKFRHMATSDELVVYPELVPVRHRVLGMVHRLGESLHSRKGRGGEFFCLHEFRQGEDPRSIHWKTSAHMDRLMVREYEEETGRMVDIFLDNRGSDDMDEALEERLERAISLAASLAYDFIHLGFKVSMQTCSGDLEAGEGPAHADKMLRHLALLPWAGEDDGLATPGHRRCILVSLRERTKAVSGFPYVVEVE